MNTLNVTSHLRNGPPGASGCLSNVVPNQIDLVIRFGTLHVWIVAARVIQENGYDKSGVNINVKEKNRPKQE